MMGDFRTRGWSVYIFVSVCSDKDWGIRKDAMDKDDRAHTLILYRGLPQRPSLDIRDDE